MTISELENKAKRGTITKGERILLQAKKNLEKAKETGVIRLSEKRIDKAHKIGYAVFLRWE